MEQSSFQQTLKRAAIPFALAALVTVLMTVPAFAQEASSVPATGPGPEANAGVKATAISIPRRLIRTETIKSQGPRYSQYG